MGRGRSIPRARRGVLLGVVLLLLSASFASAASLRAAGGAGAGQAVDDKEDLLAAASSMATAAPGQYGVIADGEIVNLGHNQQASGLRIHHPKVP